MLLDKLLGRKTKVQAQETYVHPVLLYISLLYNSLPIHFKKLNTNSLHQKVKQTLITNSLYEVGEFYNKDGAIM